MEEEALQDAHALFTGNGYKGDIDAFKNLLLSNEEARNDAHKLFAESGYKGSVDDFSTLVGLKKKVPTDSTALPSDAEKKSSPSGSTTINGFAPFLPVGEGQPKTEGFDMIPEQIVDLPVAELYDQYKEAGVITPTQVKQIDQELDRQKKGDRSWWEKADAFATGFLNTGMMIPLYKYDSKEDLLAQQETKNRVNFLESLPKEKVEELNAYAAHKTGELSKATRNVFAENAIIEEKSKYVVNSIKSAEDAIRRIQQSGKEVPIEGVEAYQGMIRELQGLSGMYNRNVDIIESNQDDIGDFSEELDFLKKNYGGLEYYQDIMRLSAADIIAGISEFGSSTLKLSNQPGSIPTAFQWEQFNKDFREEISNQRDFIKPMMSVGEINGAKDFGKWLLEQSAAQLPVITVLAAGGSPVGLSALGTSAAGQKMGDLRDTNMETRGIIADKKDEIAEMDRIIRERQDAESGQGDLETGQGVSIPAEGQMSIEEMIVIRDKAVKDLGKLEDRPYSEADIYIAGLGVGAAEVLSERVSLGILSKGKRTLSSIKSPALKAEMRQGIKDRIFETTKDVLSEGGSEFVNQMAQNSIDILYLDNQNVHILDGTEDALASGLAMGFGMSATPSLIGMGAKAFMKREDTQTLNENAQKASQVLEELETKKDILDDASKKLLKDKADSLLKKNEKQIKDAYQKVAKGLPKETLTELINLDKKANVLLRQAQSVRDSDMDPELKKELGDDLTARAEKLREQKNKLIDDAKKINVVREEGEPVQAQEPGVGDMSQIDGAKPAQTENVEEVAEPQTTEQNRMEELVSERIPAAKKEPTGEPKKLRDIMANVSKKLKSTLVYGKTKGGRVIGTYHPSNALVKVRDAGDLDTAAHELGHLLDDRFKLLEGTTNDQVITKQLKWFSERGGSNPPTGVSPQVGHEYLQREGLAEFMRAYVTNPEAAKKQAPELYDYFENNVNEETLGALREFSEDVINFANAPEGDQILSNVLTDLDSVNKGPLERAKDIFEKGDGFKVTDLDIFKEKWSNSLQIPNKAFKFMMGIKGSKNISPEDNFVMMARLLAGVNGKVRDFISEGIRDSKNKFMTDSKGERFNFNYLFKGLDTSTSKSLLNDINDVIKLLISERTIEYAERFGREKNLTGIGGGMKSDVDVALGHVLTFDKLKNTDPAKYERITEGARRYREFADAGLKYALESGRLSQEGYDTIKNNNRYYVSLARYKEAAPGEEVFNAFVTGSKLASPKDVIKKARGGSDAIKNPYMSLLANTINIVKESDRNNVMRSFIEPLTDSRKMGSGEVVDYAQVGFPSKAGEPNTLKIFKDGQEQYWRFDKDIYAALKQMGEMSDNSVFVTVMKPMADLIRNTVTTFPVFAVKNVTRDTQSSLILTRNKASLSDFLDHNKELKSDFAVFGGSQSGFYLINEQAYNKELNSAVEKLTKSGTLIMDPRKLGKKIMDLPRYGKKFGEKLENFNRLAEYKRAHKAAIKQGMDEYNAGLYAAYQARDLMDFAVAGTWMREINKVIPFSNAAVQSVKRTLKGAKENKAKFALKLAVVSILPQLLIRLLVANMGDDEEYEQLPDYQRDLFYNFKTPIGNNWVAIPKPFELGLVSSIFDRGASYALGNKEAFDGAAMSTVRTLFPFDESALMGPFRPLLEAAINKDLFRDREIIPYWEKDKALELREGTKYASRVGQALSDTFGLVGAEVDPRNIDHVIKGFTTYYGDLGLSLTDIGKEDSRNQFDFTNTGFVKGMPVSNAKSVKKALDLAESIGEQNTKPIKDLKGAIKIYYSLNDPAAKEKMAKMIYQYAEQIATAMEARKKQKLEAAKNKKAPQD